MNDSMKKHIIKSIKSDKRIDGRGALEFRDINIEYGVSATAEGSARVTMGDTIVMAGVKMSIETPYPDAPDEGTLMVGMELTPLASPDFEMGPPGIDAIEMARVIDRGIRESGAIDTKKLCVEKGEKVWIVSVDLVAISHDGNLLDAGGIAALAALKNAKFPKVDSETGKIDYHEKTDESLPLQESPVPVTVYKIGDSFAVDPHTDEEEASDARLTITTIDENTVCALQKGRSEPLTTDDVSRMVDISLEQGKKIRNL